MPPTATFASILPSAWFSGMPTLGLAALAVVTLVLVSKGADWLVDGAAGLAKRLGMPEMVVGATIVSLGTTTPEAAVSVMAAFGGNPGLALGNGVGSIIADTGLIFGAGCLITRLPADRFLLNRQGWVQIGSAVMLAALCYGAYALYGDDAALGLPVGILLTALLVTYLAVSVRWARQHPTGGGSDVAASSAGDALAPVPADPPVPPPHAPDHPGVEHGIAALFGLGLAGLVLVVIAGDALVGSVSVVAVRWGVPQAVIASTIVAFGTSLPELVTGVRAIQKGHPGLLVGNVIGADILNVLFVIGLSAVAAPLSIIDPTATHPAIFLLLPVPTMLAMLLYMRVCIVFAGHRGHFSRWMGAPLVAGYVAYLVASYAMS